MQPKLLLINEIIRATRSEAVVAWLHANWAGRTKAGSVGFGPEVADRAPIITIKDTDGEWFSLVRKTALAEAVPNSQRLDEALRLLAARGALRPGESEGKLTRQKRLSDGTKRRFLFFAFAMVRPETP